MRLLLRSNDVEPRDQRFPRPRRTYARLTRDLGIDANETATQKAVKIGALEIDFTGRSNSEHQRRDFVRAKHGNVLRGRGGQRF
jgi:hypothetical protein